MSKLLDILLQRNEPSIPWGFSIHGGFDRKIAPFVSSVTFGSLAAHHLNAGDRVLQIQRQPAGGLLQSELEKLLKDGVKDLQLLVEKISCPRWSANVTIVREPFLASNLVFGRMRKDALSRQKRFLRMSESLIEDHFKRMRDLFESSWLVTRKQQHQQASAASPTGDGPQGGPPAPPPPPPSLPTALPGRRLKTEIPERGLEPPPAIQNAMLTKDKKPFTYTPGGIDLSEIKSPKMARRINRNACAEEMTGRPAPTTNQPVPTGPPPSTPYSAQQSQLPTSVLPSRGAGGPPPPPPMPQSGAADGIPPPPPPPVPSATPAAAPTPQVKPPAFHKPQQMGFDPNEILVRANRNQETGPQRDMRQNSYGADAPRTYRIEDEPQKRNEVIQNMSKPQNEPGQIYVPPVTPKSPVVEATSSPAPAPAVNQSPRGQLGSIYVPPVSNLIQEQSTPSPTSPFSQKVHSPSPAVSSPMSPPTSAEPKSQLPWASMQRSPQTAAPSWMSSQQGGQRQPESPKPQATRIIPIQIEGRDPPKPQPQMQPQYNMQQQQQYNTQQQQYNMQQQQQQYNTQQQYVQQPQYNTQPQQSYNMQQQQYGVQQDTRQTNRQQTRVIPIQIEGASSQQSPLPGQQNKFNPMTPTSPTPYTPPCGDKEQKPQWAPVQPRPYTESPFGQQRVQNEPQRIQPQPEYGTYNTAGVPLSQLRKMQLSEDDRALMDKFKSQIEKHGNDAITDENANPRYRGGHIPSRVFKMLDESVDDETYLHRESDPRYRGPAIPSRAFRLLQNMTDTAGDLPQQVPKGPMRAPASRPAPVTPEPPAGPYVPASEQQVQEPRKYTGGSIPSRSFRMLQAMTGQEITAQNQVKGSSSSGRSTPVPGMGRWCQSPVLPPPVDPYWYLYHSDPFLMYNYVSEMNAAYGYPPFQPPYPPGRYTPTHFQTYPSYMSDSDEQGYSSTDELGQYYANYRNRMGYSPFVRNPDPYYSNGIADEYRASRSSTPSILITPVSGPKARKTEYQESPLAKEEVKVSEKDVGPMESESSSEEDSETDTDGEDETDISREINQSVQKMCTGPTLQTLKSVSDVGIYASESTATVTNEEEWAEGGKEKERDEEEEEQEEEVEEEEEESSESLLEVSQDNIPHQLSVIFEESEHSDAESMRLKENSHNSTTKSITSESETSNTENGEEESDDDALDTESSVTVRLPLKLKFSRGENDEDVTTVIVGDSEISRSEEVEIEEVPKQEEEEQEQEQEQEEEEEEEDADVSVTFSLPSRSNSVISVGKKSSGDQITEIEDEECDKPEEKKEPEEEAEVTVSFSLKKNKTPEEEQVNGSERVNSDRLSCESKTEESDSNHFEDDSSSTSADTVVKHREDTDEDETEKPEEVKNRMEDFKSWLNSENGKDWNEKTVELEKEEVEDVSYEAGVGRLEKMISSMLEKTKVSLEPEKKVKKENSQEESEDDSGVTSDMSAKHLAWETDGDTESDYSELSKMSQCQRASTHSRLFKLLQEECGSEETTEEDKTKKEPKLSPSSESLTQRKQRLSLPLNTPSEVESLSSSSGVTSPSSPTVTDRLVKELVQSLLNKKKGKKFRKLPLARLHAAALRILQEDMDPYDTSSNSASGDDGFLLSPVQKTPHSPKTAAATETNPESKMIPNEVYGANYYDYLNYYNTWGNAAVYYPEAEHEIVPSKAFRMLSLQPNAMEGLKAKCPRIPTDGNSDEGSKQSGRATPCVTPRPENDAEDDYSGLSFADKRDKVAKVLETAGKC